MIHRQPPSPRFHLPQTGGFKRTDMSGSLSGGGGGSPGRDGTGRDRAGANQVPGFQLRGPFPPLTCLLKLCRSTVTASEHEDPAEPPPAPPTMICSRQIRLRVQGRPKQSQRLTLPHGLHSRGGPNPHPTSSLPRRAPARTRLLPHPSAYAAKM